MVEQLGKWQPAIARHEAALKSNHMRHGDAALLLPVLDALLAEFELCRTDFAATIASAGPDIAANSRVVDVRNALSALNTRAEAARALAEHAQ